MKYADKATSRINEMRSNMPVEICASGEDMNGWIPSTLRNFENEIKSILERVKKAS